ncbi:MAG: helix-turn-helix domain-containing protein [Acidobacteria bacterium]|nr:helix-turn-helix domain-containing protein [Acidobacteriota bacterium]
MIDLPDRKHFRCDEVAELVGVTTRTVRRWIRSGQMPAVRFGGLLRIRREDLVRICREGIGRKAGARGKPRAPGK